MTEEIEFYFSTNIKCEGCVEKIKPVLNGINGVCNWSVDTLHPQKRLKVNTKEESPDNIIVALARIGFKASLIPKP
jgi:copper chaperone